MTEFTVTRNDDASRYEIRKSGALAGFAGFSRRAGEIRFTHTEIDPAFQGQHVGSQLAQEALTDAAASGDTIVPLCPFIAHYLETHEIIGADIRWPEEPNASNTRKFTIARHSQTA